MENNSSQSSVKPTHYFYEFEDPKLKARQEKNLDTTVSAPLYTVWKDADTLQQAKRGAKRTATRRLLSVGVFQRDHLRQSQGGWTWTNRLLSTFRATGVEEAASDPQDLSQRDHALRMAVLELLGTENADEAHALIDRLKAEGQLSEEALETLTDLMERLEEDFELLSQEGEPGANHIQRRRQLHELLRLRSFTSRLVTDHSAPKAEALLELAREETPPARPAQQFGMASEDLEILGNLGELLYPGISLNLQGEEVDGEGGEDLDADADHGGEGGEDADAGGEDGEGGEDADADADGEDGLDEDADDDEHDVLYLAVEDLLSADDADEVKAAMERIRDEGQLSPEAMDVVSRLAEDFAGDTDDTAEIVGQIKVYVGQVLVADSREEAEVVVNAARKQADRDGDPPFRVRLHLSLLADLLFGEAVDATDEGEMSEYDKVLERAVERATERTAGKIGALLDQKLKEGADEDADDGEDEDDNASVLAAVAELLEAEDAEAAQAVIERLTEEGDLSEDDLQTISNLQERIAEGKALRKYVRLMLAAPTEDEAEALINRATADAAVLVEDMEILYDVRDLRFPA